MTQGLTSDVQVALQRRSERNLLRAGIPTPVAPISLVDTRPNVRSVDSDRIHLLFAESGDAATRADGTVVSQGPIREIRAAAEQIVAARNVRVTTSGPALRSAV